MKVLFLALALGAALVVPSSARADIAPDPLPYLDVDDGRWNSSSDNDVLTWEEPRLTEDEQTLLQFPRALYVSILIELIVAAIIIAALKLPRRVLLSVPLATLVTLPFLYWWWVPEAGSDMTTLIVGEIIIAAAETGILYGTQRPLRLSLKHAAVIAILMNAASFALGFVLV
ncbi:hypothetical protein HYS28_01320 [Candidatus Uhrbacteria bacterium]|nr:hypothetical protein [Candidatus Uhrbacteria bacterium]